MIVLIVSVTTFPIIEVELKDRFILMIDELGGPADSTAGTL